MTPETGKQIAYLIFYVVISVAVVGYFVGLQSPMNPGERANVVDDSSNAVESKPSSNGPAVETDVLPATSYSDMQFVSLDRAKRFRTTLKDLKSRIDLTSEVKINPGEKEFALSMRGRNRAFNGAPPTIPHRIDQMTSQSCMACHGEGVKTETLRISKMSHQYLEACTQCHVESNAEFMASNIFKENSFVGMPAPYEGPRAFAGAPPIIPHSTWMRVDCNSCHGPTGLQGIRSTHPWQQNCTQCHAPSSQLEQAGLDPAARLLPPINIERP